MVRVERTVFKVPERRGSRKLISLDGQVFKPAHPAGTIIFTEGVGKNKDLAYYANGSLDYYRPFLKRLAKVFTVITFNHRGRGLSEGTLTPNGGLDAEGILASIKGKAALVGHSAGAAFSLQAAHAMPDRVSSVYLINPYLGAEFHRIAALIPDLAVPAVKGALKLGSDFHFTFLTGLQRACETLLGQKQDRSALLNKIKLNRRFAEAAVIGAKVGVSNGNYKVPIAFALASDDEFLGTLNNPGRHGRLVAEIRRILPNAEDFSGVLAGLNHYLNRGFRNYGNFFAEQADNRIFDSITNFTKANMGK
ncbi:alpha/beta fold hydrolase [Candidatus Woesearchaeota archaeon]|nr:alpha/beta fold hydrolase [Candidatus Woesearchaeota archaeon]